MKGFSGVFFGHSVEVYRQGKVGPEGHEVIGDKALAHEVKIEEGYVSLVVEMEVLGEEVVVTVSVAKGGEVKRFQFLNDGIGCAVEVFVLGRYFGECGGYGFEGCTYGCIPIECMPVVL